MRKTALLFPGQASQYVGMARDLFDEFESVRALFGKASDILGYDLADVCFSGPEEKLKQTAFTQPAVFVHSSAIDSILKQHGISPDGAAGHSLGEYSALVSAGGLSFDSAIKAIALRSSSMQRDCEDHPGTMAAIMGMDFDVVKEVLERIEGVVVPANYNSPGQVVIAGEVEAVDTACDQLKKSGAKRAMRIAVGGAYHSTLMDNSAATMRNYILNNLELSPFSFPVYSNVTGQGVGGPEEFRLLLSKQISSPVLWYPSLGNMYKDGYRCFVEIGPGKVLQGLARKSINDSESEIVGIDTLDQLEAFISEKAVSA